MTLAQSHLRAQRAFGRLITTTSICTCAHHHAGRGVLIRLLVKPQMHTQAGQCSSSTPKHLNTNTAKLLSSKWERLTVCSLNTVFRFSVSNILNPNTVFALLHININDLIFTDAMLLGILHAQRCQYTALLCVNICWPYSQCWPEPAYCDGQLLSLFKMQRNTNTARLPLTKWERLTVWSLNTVFAITVLTLHFKVQCLVKIANTALPNTVFALLFNKNNYLIF